MVRSPPRNIGMAVGSEPSFPSLRAATHPAFETAGIDVFWAAAIWAVEGRTRTGVSGDGRAFAGLAAGFEAHPVARTRPAKTRIEHACLMVET